MSTMVAKENLAAWRVFFCVAESGSFRAAAIELDKSTAFITRMVQALEEDLGGALIDRSVRPAVLTPYGETVHAEMKGVFRSFTSKLARLSAPSDSRSMILRISGPTGLLRHFVAPIATQRLETVDSSARVFMASEMTWKDVLNDRCDILFSADQPPSSLLGFCACMSASTVPLCSPRYLADFGEPQAPADLKHHIGITRSGRAFPKSSMLWKNGEGAEIEWAKSCEFSDMDTIREEVAAGRGITIDLPISMAVDELREGTLVPILPGWTREPWTYHAFYLKNTPRTNRIEPIALWLSAAVGQEIARLRDEAWRYVRDAYARKTAD